MTQTGLQVFTGTTYPPRHFNESNYLFIEFLGETQSIYSLNKHIYAFISKLIASTGRYNQRVVIKAIARQCIRHTKQSLACLLAFGCKSRPLGNEIIFKSIRKNEIYWLIQQLFTLQSSDITHGSEAVNKMCCLFLY